MALPFLGGIAGIQLMVAVGVGGILFHSEQTRLADQRSAYEAQVAGVVNDYLTTRQAQLKALAALPPASLNLDLPGVLKARVIPAGAEIPLDLSFTHQDMLRRLIQQRKPVAPEVSHAQGGAAVFSQVATLPGGGYLLVTTPLELLQKNLQSVSASGAVVLTQKIGEAGTLTEVAAINGAAAAHTVDIQNPNWQLKVSAPVTAPSFLWVILSALALALIAMPLLAALMIRMYERKFRHDVTVLHGVTRGEEHSSPLHFETLQELWSLLMTHGASAGRPEKSVAPGVIRTHDVEAIVQAVEEMHEPLSVQGRPALEDMLGALTEDPVEVAAPAAVKEHAPLEFTPGMKAGVAAARQDVGPPLRIFRDYDIRGKADLELTPALARKIGQAVATEAQALGERRIVVGRDARLSSDSLCQSLIEGILSTGCDVINVGRVPSPVLYHAAKTVGTGSGVMVTASHNPGGDNGFKIMLAHHTLAGDEIRNLRERILREEFAKGAGALIEQSVEDDYLQQITDDVLLAKTFNVVVDAGNGIAGPLAVRMLEEMGCTVSPLYCEPDGNFPHHDPDPSNANNLEDLLSDVAISGADLGLAFDGDGDRVVVVTNSTRIIASDKLLMLFARDVLSTQPGADIIFDVKCSRDLVSVITAAGGRPVMTRTGHSWLKSAVAESGAPLAGELSGHFIFNDRWHGFDDGLYAAARFLEILAAADGTADDLFSEFPERVATPEIQIPVSEEERALVLSNLTLQAEQVSEGTVNRTDGVRIEFAHGWGIVRASNTGSYLTARFEANDEDSLARIKDFFREQLLQADPMLLISF